MLAAKAAATASAAAATRRHKLAVRRAPAEECRVAVSAPAAAAPATAARGWGRRKQGPASVHVCAPHRCSRGRTRGGPAVHVSRREGACPASKSGGAAAAHAA